MNREALLDSAAAALARGNLAEAQAIYRAALAQTPNDAEMLSNLGAVLNIAQDHAGAESACRAALAAAPFYWAALANLGTALHRQQRFAEAVATYTEAVRANPRNASAWTNLGVALHEQGRVADSLPMHDAAVALAPEDPEIRTNRALALLMGGDLARGFAEFEWRWRTAPMAPHRVPGPLWRGEPLAGRTLLVHEEGGFGDTLQFVRFLPALAAQAAHIILRVQAPLIRLLRRSLPQTIRIIAQNDTLPPFDIQCSMLSLPRALRTSLASIPADIPYLTPDPDQVAQWRGRLRAISGPEWLRVGLVWAGAPRLGMGQMRAMDQRRSLAPSRLAPLARIQGVRFISLQMPSEHMPSQHITDPASDAAGTCLPIFDPPILDPTQHIADFDDTAALIANLDLVIAVDTAVAHLAGALGRPVWVMSRYDSCWRWLTSRADSPWYPTLRLYRQPQPGAWAPVLARIARDLRALRPQSRHAA